MRRPGIPENGNHSRQCSGLGPIARKLPRFGPDRMGSHQVRLGAVPALACRGCRIPAQAEQATGRPVLAARRFPRSTCPAAFI
jgi:hypothetical protein